jgi:hypothetical protein
MKTQAVFPGAFLQGGQESLPILVIPEHGTALIASRGDVVEGSGKLDAKRSRHCFLLGEPFGFVKLQELTPSPQPEHGTALIASRGDVVEGSSKLDAKRSRHWLLLGEPFRLVKSQELTPSYTERTAVQNNSVFGRKR